MGCCRPPPALPLQKLTKPVTQVYDKSQMSYTCYEPVSGLVRVSFCRGGAGGGGRSPHCGAPTAPRPPSQVFINYLKATSIPCFRYCALPPPPSAKTNSNQTCVKNVILIINLCHKCHILVINLCHRFT